MTNKILIDRDALLAAANRLSDRGQTQVASPLWEALAAPEVPRQDDQQMACMPVERCYDVRVKMIIAFNEAKKTGGDLDDGLDAAYKAALRYSPAMLSTVVGEAERLNGMLDAASELLRTKQRANRELRSELERIKTINDNNFNLLLDQIFAAPLSPDHSGGAGEVVLDERAEFENYYRDRIMGNRTGVRFLRSSSGAYLDREVAEMWSGWQARACLDKVKELNQ